LLNFIQVFLAINKNIIFPEKSHAESKEIFENLTIYTPIRSVKIVENAMSISGLF